MSDPHSATIEELLRARAEVRRFTRRLARDESDARDLEQSGWLRALERPPATSANPLGWFKRVVRNLAIDKQRARRPDPAADATRDSHAAAPATDDLVAGLELDQQVGEAVLALPSVYREVVILHFWEGLSTTDIAQRLGRPNETVRTQLARAQERLRQKLDRSYGDRATWAALAGVPQLTGVAGSAALGFLTFAMMKKVVVVAAVLVVAFITQRALRTSDLDAPRRPVDVSLPADNVVTEDLDVDSPIELEVSSAPAESRNRVTAPGTMPDALRCVLAGRIVSELGTPLPNVSVLFSSQQGEKVTTQADGRFRFEFESVPTSEYGLELRIDAGPTREQLSYKVPDPGAVALGLNDVGDVVLRGAGSIRVRVLGASGRPLSDAAVSTGQQSYNWFERNEPTSVDGYATIPSLLPGEHVLSVSHPTHTTLVVESVAVEVGIVTDAGDVVLRSSRLLSGVVVNRDGQPVTDCWVASSPTRGGQTFREKVDENGRFSMLLQSTSPRFISVESEETVQGMTGRNQGPFYLGTGEIRLVHEQAVPFVLTVLAADTGLPLETLCLRRMMIMSDDGSMVDRRKNPSSHALWLGYRGGLHRIDDDQIRSQSKSYEGGRVREFAREEFHGVAINAIGYQPGLVGFAVANVDELGVIRLQPRRILRGRLLEDGLALEGVKVSLLDTAQMGQPVRARVETTGADGAFVFGSLLDGSYAIEVRTATGMQLAKPIEIESDHHAGDLTLALGGSISGRVLLPAGREVKPLRVRLRPSPRRLALIHPPGLFRLDAVPPGSYVLKVQHPLGAGRGMQRGWSNLPEKNIVVVAGEETHVEFDLRANGTTDVTVDVRMQSGAWDGRGGNLYAQTDTGRHRVGVVRKGTVTGHLPAPGILHRFELRIGSEQSLVSHDLNRPTQIGESVELTASFDARVCELPVNLLGVDHRVVRLAISLRDAGGIERHQSKAQTFTTVYDFLGYVYDPESGTLTTPPLPIGNYTATITVRREGFPPEPQRFSLAVTNTDATVSSL